MQIKGLVIPFESVKHITETDLSLLTTLASGFLTEPEAQQTIVRLILQNADLRRRIDGLHSELHGKHPHPKPLATVRVPPPGSDRAAQWELHEQARMEDRP